MSLLQILEIDRQRMRREKMTCDEIYKRLTACINNCVKFKEKSCIYDIPGFIPCMSIVDKDKVMTYLMKKLRKEGFASFALTDSVIFVTWSPESIRDLNKQINASPILNKVPDSFDNMDIVQSMLNEKINERNSRIKIKTK